NRYLRSTSVQLTFFLLIPVLGTAGLYGWRRLPTELGINRGFSRGLLTAFLATLPMLLGYAWVSGGAWTLTTDSFLYGCVQAAVAEEILFRAFLFGLLYRKAGWGLIPATLVDGLVFGAVHLYQGDTVLEAVAVFAVTGAGAVWFSWLFKEWGWNLWLVIFLHFLMNFYWSGFQMADNAAGGLWANVFRAATIFLTVVATLKPTSRIGRFLRWPFGPDDQNGLS
ncbi:MAG: CPBP family intramembrane glutamic endopeptidase, partial [Bacteroidota bacterium]